jgi:TonB-linked SusC/RagA family outer membrane protein
MSILSSLSAETYSQTTKLTVTENNSTLMNVLRAIEEQSEFKFFYNEKVDVTMPVSVEVTQKSISEILDKVLSSTSVKYKVIGRQIALYNKDEMEPFMSEQQGRKVTGKVTDFSGATLPGVSVVVKGTANGVITDNDGKFSLANIPENATLLFSFVGMKSKEIAVQGKTTVNIKLEDETIGIEEVVAIGYGTQKKVNVIGSVINITNEQLNASPVAKVSNALAGRLPGAIIQQQNGQPGMDDAKILIRGNSTLGNNSPLIVIDGIPGRDLNSIEPGDIESLAILKDASAAIYGARAANGVILVTTKRGIEGAPTLKYDFYQGWEQPTLLPKMADAATYAQLIREVQSYRGVAESNMQFSKTDVDKYKSGQYPWTYPNSDWFGLSLKNFTNSSHHNLSVSGGAKIVNYYHSLGTTSDNGIYKANSTTFNRYNLKGNVVVKINEYLNIGLDINGSQENRMNPAKSADAIWGSMFRNKPTGAAIWPNGLPGPDIEYGDQPIVSSSLLGGFDDDKRYRINNMLTVNFKVPKVEGLSISGYFAYDVYFLKRKLFQKPVTLYDLNKSAYLAAGNTGEQDGSAFLIGSLRGTIPEPRLNDYSDFSRTTTYNLKANYERTINGVHNISAFVATEASDYKGEGINAFRRYYMSDKLPYLFAGGNSEINNGSWIGIDSRLNYFGRVAYNFKETFLFQFSLRRDGSLRFSKESGRWGTFPSVLAGWRVSSENFWKNNLKFINYFKIRASWGKMGNDAVNPFQYLTSYGFGTGMVFGTSKLYQSSLVQSGMPNPDITWEVANVYNAGFESFWFDNKLQFNAEAFYQRRNDILVKRNASVPTFTGIGLPDENFGIVDSKGFETVLGYTNKSGDFSYSISGNFAFAKNTVIEFDEPVKVYDWQTLTGHPQGSLLLYKNIGVFKDNAAVAAYPHVSSARPGDIIIEDYNNDGKITQADQILFDKTGTPQVTYGLSFSLSYKNFEFSGLLQGVGNTMRRVTFPLMGVDGNYLQFYADGRWTPDNIEATKPRIFMRTEEYWRDSYLTDYEYNNMAFCRLKNMQLSYTLPKNLTKKIWLKNAKIYVSGQNLFLLYNAFVMNQDPELGSTSGYPLMKVYAAGLQIEF